MFIRIPSCDAASNSQPVPRVNVARRSVVRAIMLLCHLLITVSSSSVFGGHGQLSESNQSETNTGEKQQAPNQSDLEPEDTSTSGQVDNPDRSPPPIPRITRADAVIGHPYGAARLTIPISPDSKWRPDQPIAVRAADDRLLFPCHHVHTNQEGDELVIHFLFRGNDPLAVDVTSASDAFAQKQSISIDEDEAGHKALLEDWWTHYATQLVEGPSDELSSVGKEVITILGRQLGLRTPQASNSHGKQSSELEKQFERSIGMLLGFESVRLAMMKDISAVTGHDGPAVSALPSALRMQAVPVPYITPGSVEIERMASYIPREYFYLRCESLQNYLWMRNLVMGWGGSLDQMVATPVVEQRVRERIERQLCLDSSLARELDLDAALEDFAIVGGDMYFDDGAAVGVLMLAKKPTRIAAILGEMRRAVAATGGARHRTLTINGRIISLYETTDNAIRSFHAVSGDCHLVTNSSMLVERFLDCEKGDNLASLPEFHYARSKFPLTRDMTSFLYLSDPFFRSLTSPATRIEASRRQRAAAELRQLKLAKLIFGAQGLEGDGSIANLIQHRLLAPEFGKRADGAFPDFTQDGQMVDSLRGGMGTFLPIADMAVTKATYREVDAYAEFMRNYRREWAAMDPVAVALHRHPGDDPHDERVDLEIAITPYARDAYQFLARRLAPPSGERVKAPETDVLTLSTQLQGATKFDVCVGLRDAIVPFHIENGTLIREGDFENRTFADWQSYAAVTPASTNGLQLLGEFTKALQSREIDPPPEINSPHKKQERPQNFLDVLDNVIHYRRYALRESLDLMLDAFNYVQIRSDGKWTTMARNGALRNQVSNDLFLERTSMPTQIQLNLADINQSRVAPYLHAVSWEAGRRLSGENAAWLNHFAATTRLDLTVTRARVEELIGGELRCPLGGTYEYRREAETTQLASTTWGCLSRFEETTVPANYQLPFLAWLRGMKLNFDLSATTLTSRVELHVDPTVFRNASSAARGRPGNSPAETIGDDVRLIELEQLYERLLLTNRQLSRSLDRIDPSGAWTIYLSIPPQSPRDDNDLEKLRFVAARFQRITTDDKYHVITNSIGFAETHSRLKKCIASLIARDAD